MRVPSQFLFFLFAISVTVDARPVPKGGKYLLHVEKPIYKLTAVSLTGEKHREVGDHPTEGMDLQY